MKNTIKIVSIALLIFATACQGQQTLAFKNELKNNIEAKKNLYIGKTINHLLANISYPVKSYMSSSYTNQTNNVTLYFITNKDIKKRVPLNSPIAMTVYFTQEKDIKVIDAMLRRNQLTWTNEEKSFFGNLIVKDIYVGGNL